MLKRSAGWNVFNPDQVWPFVLLTALATVVGAWLLYHLYAVLIRFTAHLLGSNGNLLSVKIVLAWSLIPYICSTVLILPKIAYFGLSIFTDQKILIKAKASTLLNVINGLELIFWLWTAIILVAGIKVALQVNLFKALMSVALPPLIASIVFGVLTFLILDLA